MFSCSLQYICTFMLPQWSLLGLLQLLLHVIQVFVLSACLNWIIEKIYQPSFQKYLYKWFFNISEASWPQLINIDHSHSMANYLSLFIRGIQVYWNTISYLRGIQVHLCFVMFVFFTISRISQYKFETCFLSIQFYFI